MELHSTLLLSNHYIFVDQVPLRVEDKEWPSKGWGKGAEPLPRYPQWLVGIFANRKSTT